MKLEIKGISKRYKNKVALNNVDLNLTPGVGIIRGQALHFDISISNMSKCKA